MSTLAVITTYRCNLACDYCYNETHDGVAAGYRTLLDRRPTIDRGRVADCVAACAERSYRLLTLTGGEPLLAPATPWWITTARDSGLAVRLITNGTVLPERVIAALGSGEGVTASVSIGGPDAASHNLHRGLWDATMANLERLRRHVAHLQLSMVLTAESLPLIPEVEDLGHRLGAAVRLSALSLGREIDRLASSSLACVDEHTWASVADKCRDPTLAADLAVIRSFYAGRLSVRFCPMRTRSQVLDPFGDLYGCFYRRDLHLGNIHDRPLGLLLDSLDRKALLPAECFGEHCLTMLYH